MSLPLRIALLVNPFTLDMKGGDHAPTLARELLGLGHIVRGFGAPPGAIPRSGAGADDADTHADESVGLVGFAPDAIIAYDALSPAAWLGARTARRLQVPLVLVEAGARSDERWRGRMLRRIGETLWGPYVRHTAASLVALHPLARERALERGFPPARVSVWPAGVDLNVYRPGLSSGLILRHHIRGRILLYVGAVAADRGLETLVSVFAQTVGQRGDWSFVFAGDGPARAELRALIDRLGIGSCVHWIGRPREEELPGLMSASTLLAVPALDERVRGQHIPRAMACGLPVIASNRASLGFLIEHEASGLIAEGASHASWTEMLRRASMSPDARKRWSQHAREVAQDRLSWTRAARTFESIVLRARGELVPLAEGEPAPHRT